MTLRNEDDPVVVIRKQEGKFKGEAWIKDDKISAYEDGSGHILCDLAVHEYNHKAVGTWIGLEAQRLR